MGEPLDEPAVEVGKAQERLHFLPVRQNRPFHYSSYLDWVHLNGILGNNHSKHMVLVGNDNDKNAGCVGRIGVGEVFRQSSDISPMRVAGGNGGTEQW